MTVLDCPELALATDVGLGGVQLAVLMPLASLRCKELVHDPDAMVDPGTVVYRREGDRALLYAVQGGAEPYPREHVPTALAADVVLALTWQGGHDYACRLPRPHAVGWWLHRPGLNLDRPVRLCQVGLGPDATWAQLCRRAHAAPPGLLLLSTVWRGALRCRAYVRSGDETVRALPTVTLGEVRDREAVRS